jgi:TPR repeat protein
MEAYNKQLPTYTPYQRAVVEYQVAEMYLWGVPKLVPQDFKEAFALFKDSAEDGFVHSIDRIALMYRYGIGTEIDFTTAHKWIELLANTGDAHAQYINAIDYLNGTGVPKDTDRAVYWLQKSALKDYIPAINALIKLNKMGEAHMSQKTTEDWQNILEDVGDEMFKQHANEPLTGIF